MNNIQNGSLLFRRKWFFVGIFALCLADRPLWAAAASHYLEIVPSAVSDGVMVSSGSVVDDHAFVVFSTGPWRMSFLASQMLNLVSVHVEVQNLSSGTLKVSPNLFSITNPSGSRHRPLSPRTYMRSLWGDVSREADAPAAQKRWEETVRSPSFSSFGLTPPSGTRPDVKNRSPIGRSQAAAESVASAVVNPLYRNQMSQDADFLEKNTLFGSDVEPGQTVQGYLYFLPGRFPLTFTTLSSECSFHFQIQKFKSGKHTRETR